MEAQAGGTRGGQGHNNGGHKRGPQTGAQAGAQAGAQLGAQAGGHQRGDKRGPQAGAQAGAETGASCFRVVVLFLSRLFASIVLRSSRVFCTRFFCFSSFSVFDSVLLLLSSVTHVFPF